CTAALTPGTLTSYRNNRSLRPGVTPVSLELSSSDTNVGTILNTPRALGPGQACTSSLTPNFQFDPIGGGTATISLTTPAGYATPSSLAQTRTATVTAAGITYVYPNYQMAKDTQDDGFYVQLGAPAPAGGVTVTLTSSDPTRLLLAQNNSTSVGSASITVNIPAGQYYAHYSIQALADNGTVTVEVSAPGYTGTNGSHPLTPLGFYISTGDISTTTLSANTAVTVCTAALTPGTLTSYRNNRSLRPGVTPVSLELSSSDTNVGTILNSPRTLGPGQACTSSLTPNFEFDPMGGGTATISLTAPAGYATPSNLAQTRTATVN
ncbi:MAG: hypothetical protein AB1805_01810, partial [Nitrospirota bacterium]